MDMLFNAFEKHQYYNIKDLVTITNQPISYLKEILKEICEYSVKNPHKNTWHLKAEYRHYASDDKKEGKKKEDGGDDAAKMTDSEDDDF
jgi:transcription initiation factor TFIIF subunit beta